MTGIACVLMDKAGRRPLLLMSFSGMTVSAVLLGTYFAIQPAHGVPREGVRGDVEVLQGAFVVSTQ